MRIREAKEVLFSIVLIFVLLLSGMEATNYVILSWTKEGLRELRLAYRERRVLATSLASVQSSNSVLFTRASNGLRLAETVIRYGVIDDCIVSSSYQDVLFFSQEFAQVPPGEMSHLEADIMNVYLGVKNITDSVFLSKHSNTSVETTANRGFITSNSSDVSSGFVSLQTANGASNDPPSVVLSAKIASARNSSFWHMFKRHLQVMKISRECVQFQKQAAENLEMLLLLPSDSDIRPSTMQAYFNSSDRNHGAPSLPRRHRHHHGDHLLHQHGTHINDDVVNEPLDKAHEETMKSHDQQNSGTTNGTESRFISTENLSIDLGNHSIHKVTSRDIKHTTEGSILSPSTGDSGHTPDGSISPLGTGVTGYTKSSISSLSTGDKGFTKSSISSLNTGDKGFTKGSVSSLGTKDTEHTTQRTTDATQSPTEDSDLTSEHSTSVMPSNRSLHNSSLINSDNDNTFLGDMYKSPFAGMNTTAYLAPLGSPESPQGHHRQKRDLLTGWMIFPGTKWCGDGDIAENKHDMGYHVELDKCCRRHDLCPLVISRLTWKYGMFNYRLHTLSHCRCDRKFRKCLKASSSPLAHLIGQIYFNVVGPQCFKFTQKSTCVQRHWWGGCRQYANSKVAFAKKQRRFK